MTWETIWRAKWLTDGATTISEMATKLRAAADDLDDMAAMGATLRHPVEDDYADLATTDGTIAKRFGFHKAPVLCKGCGEELIAAAEKLAQEVSSIVCDKCRAEGVT